MNGGSRDWDGRFWGYRANVEDVPRLPTFPARWTVQDPRGCPYLVAWRPLWRGDEGVKFALRLEPAGETAVRYRYPSGFEGTLSLVWRNRAGGRRALFWRCGPCGRDRLFLYLVTAYRAADGRGWASLGEPRCSACAGLRWRSQGDYHGSIARMVRAGLPPGRRLPNARHPWDPVAVANVFLLSGDFPELGKVGIGGPLSIPLAEGR